MRDLIEAELTRQLLPLVYALAGAGDRPNLILYWLMHTKIKSEVTSGEIFWGIFQLYGWTQTPATRKLITYVVRPGHVCVGT